MSHQDTEKRNGGKNAAKDASGDENVRNDVLRNDALRSDALRSERRGPQKGPAGTAGSVTGAAGSAAHGTAGSVHGTAGSLHGTAGSLHGTAGSLHGAAGSLHGAAGSAAQGAQAAKKHRYPASADRAGRDEKEPEARDRAAKSGAGPDGDRKIQAAHGARPGKPQSQQKMPRQYDKAAPKSPRADHDRREDGKPMRGPARQGQILQDEKDRRQQDSAAPEYAADYAQQQNRDPRARREPAHAGQRQNQPARGQHAANQNPHGQAPHGALRQDSQGGAAAGAKTHGAHGAGAARERGPRHPHPHAVHAQKIKVRETLEDIKTDITRIEKEIDLEIKEIQNLKLAL